MPQALGTNEFLSMANDFAVLDARTPAEFERGHIPGAHNIPLFTNEERAIVGTLYKQEGREAAILKGLELVGPKLSELVTQSKNLVRENTLLVHCWRGGMRSGSLAWLLETYGFKVYTLKGGYKFFRRRILSAFEEEYPMTIMGGKTGSSKSRVLEYLKQKNIQVIDLEGMACHKGSSYGHLGEASPPTQEMFENLLGYALLKLDKTEKIIVEDESRMIGTKSLPNTFFNQLRKSPVLYLDVSFNHRVEYLSSEYGKFPKDQLIEATRRIERRLGPEQTKQACKAIEEGQIKEACAIILGYYDKAYDHGLSQRDQSLIHRLTISDFNPQEMENILEHVKRNVPQIAG